MKRRALSILRLRRSFVFQPIAAILAVALIPLLSRFEGQAGIRISEASAQVAPTNPILKIGLTTVASDLRELESDAVNAYLALHGLPATDSSIIYTYGRSDLRSEIRGLMINILLGIIAKPASQRTVHERNLYKWLLELVQQNEIAEYTQAVNQFNSWNTNKCFFKLDSDLATQYKISYEGTPFCTNNLAFGIFVPPPVPVASYFTAYGLKFSYGKPAQTDPDFASIVADTGINVAAVWGIAAGISAIVVGAAAALLAKSLALVGTAKLAVYTSAAVLSGAAVATLGAAVIVTGVVAIILVTIAIGVAAGIQAVSNQQAIDEGNNLTSLLNQARNTPPDLGSFATDSSGLGMYKLQATFDAQTLPEAASTATLPPHGLSDLNFAILIANGTKTTISNALAYQDWSGINWSAQTSGSWFVQQCNSGANCRQPDSITGQLRFVDWSGTKWSALRLGNKFIAIKEKPAETDKDCEPSPVTGVSPGSDFSNCKSYLSESIPLQGPNGVLETVSFSVLAAPVFNGPTTLPFTPKVASSQVITVSGNPTPRICFAGSTPPLPSDFTLNGAPLNTNACAEGSFKLTFNGNAASPQQNYLLTLVAANGSSTQPESGQFTLDVSPHLGIVSPSHLTGRAGFPFNFLVDTTGFPTPTLTVDPGALVNGLSFKDNGNGTATISGIVRGAVSNHRCLNNGGDCGIRASNSQGKVLQLISVTMNPAPRASVSEPTSATFIWGAPNSVTLTSSGASTPVSWDLDRGTAPAWLHFTDNGDGTANLYGTPPRHAIGKHEPGVSPIALGSGPFVFFVKYPIYVLDLPVFVSSSTAAFTVGSPGSFTASANQGTIGLVGTLPTGLSFSSPGTLGCPNDPSAACITGTPAAGTTGQYNVVLTDDAGSLGSISQPLTINVYQSPAITSSSMATFITGTPSTFAVTTTGFPNTSIQPLPPNSGPPTSPNDGKGMFFTVVRGLPADLRFSNLNPAGFATGTLTITGVPSAADAGLRAVQITAQNGVGATANQTILLNILPLTAPAPAGANACNGNYNSVFAGDLAVSGGQNCTFVGGGVTGNILVDGGSLALFGATINQNVTIQGASSAFAIDSGTEIGGSLNISGIGNPPRNEICGSVVNGDVTIDGNMTPLQIGSFAAACLGNVFGGNLTVMNSTASMGIYNNVIGNTLACTNDTNIIGQGNAAAAKTGICAPF